MVWPDVVMVILTLTLRRLPFAAFGRTSDTRAVPALNDSTCLIGLPATVVSATILAAVSGAPVSLRRIARVKTNFLPARGCIGSARGVVSSGFTTKAGFGSFAGEGTTGAATLAFSVSVLSAGLPSARPYAATAVSNSSPAEVTFETIVMFPTGASPESQSRLQRSFPAPILVHPDPRSVVAETTCTPAGKVTST